METARKHLKVELERAYPNAKRSVNDVCLPCVCLCVTEVAQSEKMCVFNKVYDVSNLWPENLPGRNDATTSYNQHEVFAMTRRVTRPVIFLSISTASS